MLLSALDPALLLYEREDWQYKKPHCFSRHRALFLHLRVTREYDQRIAMSSTLVGLITARFPWNAKLGKIGEFHDLKLLMLEVLNKGEKQVDYIDIETITEANLQPTGVLCEHVEDREIIDAWKGILCVCMGKANSYNPQIATWETPAVRQCRSVTLTIADPEAATDTQHKFPLVWDDDSWAIQLARQDWWPDLQRCVELEFKTNPGIRRYPECRKQPIPFKCTEEFQDSLERFCEGEGWQRSLIESLTKKVYGIHVGIDDKSIGGVRKFRGTYFWRVHYRMEDGQIVLLEFRPH